MPRSSFWVVLVLSLSSGAVPPLQGQTATSRAAISLRIDNLLAGMPAYQQSEVWWRLGPDSATVRQFFAGPRRATPPTYEQLQRALIAAYQVEEGQVEEDSSAIPPAPAPPPPPFEDVVSHAPAVLPTQAALILGIADFMLERALDELVFAYLIDLQNTVSNDNFFIYGTPNSYAVLDAMEAENFQTLMPALRASFKLDLHQLPATLGSTAFLDKLGIDENRARLQALSLAFEVGSQVRSGTSPGMALSRLHELDPTRLEDAILRGTFILVGSVAQEYVVAEADLMEVMGTPKGPVFFTAFLTADLIDQIGDQSGGPEWSSILAGRDDDIALLIKAIDEIDELSDDVGEQLGDSRPSETDHIREAIAVSESVLDLFVGIRRWLPEDEQAQFGWVDDAIMLNRAVAQRDYALLLASLITSEAFEPVLSSSPQALTFLALGTSLAAAETPEDMTTALRVAASPVGTYRLKRVSRENWDSATADSSPFRRTSVSITGFAGVQAGYEQTTDAEASGAHTGLALPLGVELSTGIPGGSISIFAPIIDLGTIASARIGGDEVATADLSWERVFAPGLFAVWGISPEHPFALGVGYQSVPNMRVHEDTGEVVSVWRLSAFFGIDETLFRF